MLCGMKGFSDCVMKSRLQKQKKYYCRMTGKSCFAGNDHSFRKKEYQT